MPKILSAAQLKALDTYTIQHTPIASIELMERACAAFVQWFVERFDATQKIGIVCGTGNNGGDGLGIARLLSEWGYPVMVWVVKGTVKETDDFNSNFHRLPERVKVIDFAASSTNVFAGRDVLVDALFGYGLSRPAEGVYGEAIDAINASHTMCIAVDVPSGLLIDQPSSGHIVRATHTVSFQVPKLAFLLPQNYSFVGRWHLVDIGLDKNFLKEIATPWYYSDKKSVRRLLKERSTFDHKGIFGKGLIIAGSYGKMGACVLASRAALRAGIGLLTVHVPREGYSIMQTAVPEAMVQVDQDDYVFSSPASLEGIDVIGIGPGIGTAENTVKALKKILASGKPMVLDADALNIISNHSELIHLIPSGSILTPHVKEFERLVGPWKNDFERLAKQAKLAQEIKGVVLVKGAFTAVASSGGELFFNSTGNPGMATGGSGDVLTGILTGLLAQSYSAEEAAILGTYLHGLSGDLAVRERGMHSLIASDLVDFLPMAYRDLVRG